MTARYGKFEMPDSITFDEETATNTYTRFVAEPFERGFGHTVGNSMRRMLLSSLEAPAIVSCRIEGVSHEYMAIEGVIEDMTTIILNLKGALIRRIPREGDETGREPRTVTRKLEVTQADLDKGRGQMFVTLGHLIQDSLWEVINPEMVVFTVTQPMTKQVDLKIAIGRGYVPTERLPEMGRVVDEILIDAAFSPVRMVHYTVENTRVGQDTDFDRLILEVHTDGRVSPREALNFSARIVLKHFEVFQVIENESIVFEDMSEECDADHDEIIEKLALRIDEIELSVRSTNCLSGANIETIAELVSIPERKMLDFRNFGKKSLNEIKAKLTEMGLSLGMDLSRYGITADNVKAKMAKYMEERRTSAEALTNGNEA